MKRQKRIASYTFMTRMLVRECMWVGCHPIVWTRLAYNVAIKNAWYEPIDVTQTEL